MNGKKTLAILVGGGPAPGINAVIAAATIEARNHGLRVLGCYDGFKWLVQGDTQHVVDLEINDTSRIHFDGGSIIRTSRTNPSKSAEAIRQVGDALQRLGVNRSEEHTSELQSRLHLVCRLLLEKKKNMYSDPLRLVP